MLNPIELTNIEQAQIELKCALNLIEFLSGVYQESDNVLHNDLINLKDNVSKAIELLEVK